MRRRTPGRIVDTRPVGEGADGEEFAVSTMVSPIEPGVRPYALTPCSTCPWRIDQPTGRFPAQAFRESAHTAYDMAERTFACHKTGAAAPRTCAGFLLRNADHNLAVRMGAAMGRYKLHEVSDGGLALYRDYRSMAVANGVPADDPTLRPCRGNED